MDTRNRSAGIMMMPSAQIANRNGFLRSAGGAMARNPSQPTYPTTSSLPSRKSPMTIGYHNQRNKRQGQLR